MIVFYIGSFSTTLWRKAIPYDGTTSPQYESQLNQTLQDAKEALENGDPQAALNRYYRAEELNPSNSGNNLYNIGVCLYQLGNHSHYIPEITTKIYNMSRCHLDFQLFYRKG